LTERHKIKLIKPIFSGTSELTKKENLINIIKSHQCSGLIIELDKGYPSRSQLRIIGWGHQYGIPTFAYWPKEGAIEVVDKAKLRSYWKIYAFIICYRFCYDRFFNKGTPDVFLNEPDLNINDSSISSIDQLVTDLSSNVSPVKFDQSLLTDDRLNLLGLGIYLRTDYWSLIVSGGSYGHTCYVAKELAARSSSLICFMGSSFPLLDTLGLKQNVLQRPSETCNEVDILQANESYYLQLREKLSSLQPSYIYERLCLGNFVGARLSLELGIPYIVEYNGSEISMMKSFAGKSYENAALFEKIEEFAFNQATIISVISSVVKESLVKRGIHASKILINPNGADPNAYVSLVGNLRQSVRQKLGFNDTDCVIGFTATFGGWHGIDVLAKAIPMVCEQCPTVRWLLIGDGTYRQMVEDSIVQNKLSDRVVMTGRVPQEEGAKLLGVCDIFVSPHSSHMIDSPFFGSPTKLFEYMSLEGGIVASDLEQIGEILSPALRVRDFQNSAPVINLERGVLCKPGDVSEFVEATVNLVRHPLISKALGKNSRKAILEQFSWGCHVDRLMKFIHYVSPAKAKDHGLKEKDFQYIKTEDGYKDEVQNQWNNDPCGSHYVKKAEVHSLDWYLEVESYRYNEYAPWMLETMEFSKHSGKKVLEIGAGMGTDLAQFAKQGALVTDYDLSAHHLALAQENFKLRGLTGKFFHGDAETLPFEDNSFDLVYSNGVIHHTPNTSQVIKEIFRVLKPQGKIIIMVYAENSLHYWAQLVYAYGIKKGWFADHSIGDIMSHTVELTNKKARPLVKVYTAAKLKELFSIFSNINIIKRQLTPAEVPSMMRWIGAEKLQKFIGWNLIIKAQKPI